jgi:hypothetical protein
VLSQKLEIPLAKRLSPLIAKQEMEEGEMRHQSPGEERMMENFTTIAREILNGVQAVGLEHREWQRAMQTVSRQDIVAWDKQDAVRLP